MNLVDLAAYCRRLGYAGPLRPDLETLRALLILQPASITYENIDVLLDRGIDLSPAAVDDKLLHRGRGGYCYEQNGLLKRVLTEIGFNVTGLAARVQWNVPADAPPRRRSHMALRVMIEGVPWLADAGFGSCVPTVPLRLDVPDPQPSQHETFRAMQVGTATMIQAEIAGVWRPVYELAAETYLDNDYEPLNWFAATHPNSHFRDSLKVARTTPQARATLLNGRLTIRKPNGETNRQILNAAEIGAALRDVFALPVEDSWAPMLRRVEEEFSNDALR